MKKVFFLFANYQPQFLLKCLEKLSIEFPDSFIYIYIDNCDNKTAPFLNKIKFKYGRRCHIKVVIDLPKPTIAERFDILSSYVDLSNYSLSKIENCEACHA